MFIDVVFPLKLRPLTYKAPADAPADLKGRIVSAPIGGRNSYGIVVKVMDRTLYPEEDLKYIRGIYPHFTSLTNLSFLKWLSDYYLTHEGVALKSAFFEEAVKIAISYQLSAISDPGKTAAECQSQNTDENSGPDPVVRAIRDRTYKTFLFHAQSLSQEVLKLAEILKNAASDINGAIILVPEIHHLEIISPVLHEIFRERLCILHSKLSKKQRMEAITRIVTGVSDVIAGTRSAILAPIKEVSFIAVLGEHDPSYKGEESPRYNGRDAAVMKGFIEKSCVFLSSTCPSVESFHNVMTGKYTQIAGNLKSEKRPRIKIIAMKRRRKKDLSISDEVLKEAGRLLTKNERTLFLINRKGHSLVKCDDCGHISGCSKCSLPLVFIKTKNVVRCNFCGREAPVPDTCEECRGPHINPFGAGTGRVKEEIEKLLKAEAVIIEKGQDPSPPLVFAGDAAPFVIGTDYATRRVGTEAFSSAVLVNMDSILSRPDFRTYERAFQEVIQVSQTVRRDGSIFLQVWDSKNSILKFISSYDFEGFYKYELAQRKALDYPPYSKIILFNIYAKDDTGSILQHIGNISGLQVDGVEVLGPVEIPSYVKAYKHCIQIMLKSRDRKLIQNTARELLLKPEQFKKIKVNVDVDPYKI